MNEVQRALKKRYPHIHPLMFQRACEKARSDGELFDMLETMPNHYPIFWDDEKREWTKTNLLQDDEQQVEDETS